MNIILDKETCHKCVTSRYAAIHMHLLYFDHWWEIMTRKNRDKCPLRGNMRYCQHLMEHAVVQTMSKNSETLPTAGTS